MYFVYLGLNSFSLFSIFNLFHATLGLGVCGMYVDWNVDMVTLVDMTIHNCPSGSTRVDIRRCKRNTRTTNRVGAVLRQTPWWLVVVL